MIHRVKINFGSLGFEVFGLEMPFLQVLDCHNSPGRVIDYERIQDIEFWIPSETNSTPILDSNEIETFLYNEESIPIVGLDNEVLMRIIFLIPMRSKLFFTMRNQFP
jgi:hypothetical protein